MRNKLAEFIKYKNNIAKRIRTGIWFICGFRVGAETDDGKKS